MLTARNWACSGRGFGARDRGLPGSGSPGPPGGGKPGIVVIGGGRDPAATGGGVVGEGSEPPMKGGCGLPPWPTTSSVPPARSASTVAHNVIRSVAGSKNAPDSERKVTK
jgi:hypothetical protein